MCGENTALFLENPITQQKIVKFSRLLVDKLFENELILDLYRQSFIDL